MKPLHQTLADDYGRHGSSLRHLGLWVVGNYHFGTWAARRESRLGRWVGKRLYAAASLLVELGTGCTIDRRTQIGDGLWLVHGGNTRIHPDVVIGERCQLMNDVTIGLGPDRPGVPRIGDDVFIGAGARILGPVTIGDGARIAANTLVITDVPPGATIIGVPGRPLPAPRKEAAPAVPATASPAPR